MEPISAVRFVEENLRTIFAYALSRVSERPDAEDLTNDIVLAILQSADKIKNEEAFYGYVWGIAANTYRKFMRKKSRFSWDEIEDNVADGKDFTEEVSDREEEKMLRREIALLAGEYRECTIAYYYEELSCAEVSKKLGLSLEMVKYYLFKTRKILKEGICMEREFGEKSFHPAHFEFVTIFSGNENEEYDRLFSRKLPGQILLSAYYTPMTVRELAIELGVACVYLEDELALLEKYRLISKTPAGKYQTRLVIFTEESRKEFWKKSESFLISALAAILSGTEEKLDKIREVNRICGQLSDNRLLWALLWSVMRQGLGKFEEEHPALQEKEALYEGAAGITYGIADEEFDCGEFAGYAGIDEKYYASAADFSVLPERNHYFKNRGSAVFREKIYKTVYGEIQPEFMILTEGEEKKIFKTLSAEISMMAQLYNQLFSCDCQVMGAHAPGNVNKEISRIVFQSLFFRTVGLIGDCAVKAGLLALPDFEGPAAMYIRENTKAVKEAYLERRLKC